MTIKQQGGIFGRNPTFNNVGVDGNLTVDTISEKTTANGVAIDGVTLKDGNVVLGSGNGIDFSATSGAGTSELLEDYEEGTWTPTVTSTAGTITTVENIQGYYTKIGRVVTLWASAKTTDNGTGSGLLSFAGLPFAPANTTLAAVGYTGAGYNTSSGLMLRGTVNGTGNAILVTTYDYAYPTASGRSSSVSVTYYV